MPPRAPFYLPTETVSHADDLEFSNQVNTGLSDLAFSHMVNQGLAGLKSMITPQPQPQAAIPLGNEQGGPAPLDVIVSPSPQVQALGGPPSEASGQAGGMIPDQPMVSSAPAPTLPGPTALPAPYAGDIGTGGPMGAGVPDQTAQRPSASPQSGTPAAMPTGAPPDASSWEGKAYAAAVKAGHPNPSEFVEQIRQESGYAPDVISGKRASSAGALGIAQIMPATAAGWGVDPLDPDAALVASAQHMADYYKKYGDSDHALAAYNMGEGNLQKYGPHGLPETHTYITRIQGAAQPMAAAQPKPQAPGQPSTEVTQAGLDDPDKWALCGPVAAVLAASTRGKNWTVAEAKRLATSMNLWDPGTGMHGLDAQTKLLNTLGVQARTGEANEQHLATDAQSGNTPIVSTPRHYFILQGYDPATGTFDTGSSGTVLKGGSRYLTLAQIQQLGGGIQGAAYIDNPGSSTPSVAASSTTAAVSPAAADPSRSPVSGAMPTDGATPGPPAAPSMQAMSYRMPLQPTAGPDTVPTDAAGAGQVPTFQDDYTSQLALQQPLTPSPAPPEAAPEASYTQQATDWLSALPGRAAAAVSPYLPDLSPRPAETPEEQAIQDEVVRQQAANRASVAAIPSTISNEGIVGPISRPIASAIGSVIGKAPATPEQEAAPFTLPTPLGTISVPNISRTLDPVVRTIATLEPGPITYLDAQHQLDAIDQQAGEWISAQGRQPSVLMPSRDADWRAAHPELAQQYQELQGQQGLLVGGTVGAGGDVPRTGGARGTMGVAQPSGPGAVPQGARRRLIPQGARQIQATPEAEVSRLRLDKFPEEVRGDIEAAAKDVNYAREQRRGVMPDEVVQRLAADDQQSVDALIKGSKAGKTYNPEETVGLRNAVASQASVVRDLSEQIATAREAGHAPELLVARRAAEATKLNGLVQLAEGARAEAGRTLRQYRQQAKLIELNPDAAVEQIYKKLGGRDNAAAAVDEYTKLVQDGANPIQLAKFWAKVESGEITGADLFGLYRRFNMLSGPRTFEVNGISGAANLAYEALGQATGQVARGRVSEAASELAAPLAAMPRAFKNMIETMFHGVSAEQAARGDIPRNLSSRTDNPLAKAALTGMEIPDRLNAGVDQFFRTMTEDWAARMLAHKQARAAGLTPRSPGWADAVTTHVQAIRDDPSKFPQLKEMADHVTFSEDMGALGKALAGVQRVPYIGQALFPFLKTPYNIASRAVDLSPLGIPRTAFEAATGKGRGTQNIGRRVRDTTIGTAATLWAYDQAQQGNITGKGPDDPEKQAMLRRTGWQPYSVKIGDQYWSYANMAPFSLALSMGAAASEAQKYAKPGKTDTLSMLSDGAARTAGVVSDMTVLAGLGAVVKSIQDPSRYGTQWLTQFLQTLIPAGSAINTYGQATDPKIRRSERTDVGTQVSQNLEARVPGLRQTVPAAQGPLGEDIESEQTGLRALNPFRPTTERPDPVIQTFLDAGVDIGAPHQALTLRPGAPPIDLSPSEQRRWNTLRGEQLGQTTATLAQSQSYQSADRVGKQAVLARVLSQAANLADARLLQEMGQQEIERRLNEAIQQKKAS